MTKIKYTSKPPEIKLRRDNTYKSYGLNPLSLRGEGQTHYADTFCCCIRTILEFPTLPFSGRGIRLASDQSAKIYFKVINEFGGAAIKYPAVYSCAPVTKTTALCLLQWAAKGDRESSSGVHVGYAPHVIAHYPVQYTPPTV